MDVDAVVLAGGRAQRLGGVDKVLLLDAEGVPLLSRALAAVAQARRVVVVGPDRDLASLGAGPLVVQVREDPPFGGPAAAIAAALPLIESPWVLVLAGDQPRVGRGVAALLEAVQADPVIDGAVLVDAEDRPQWLAACYHADALRAALVDHETRDSAIGALLSGLRLASVPDRTGASDDVDTPADVDRLLG
jgi:molybdopterin-guanine dinucleotide biosynthesis protein A